MAVVKDFKARRSDEMDVKEGDVVCVLDDSQHGEMGMVCVYVCMHVCVRVLCVLCVVCHMGHFMRVEHVLCLTSSDFAPNSHICWS